MEIRLTFKCHLWTERCLTVAWLLSNLIERPIFPYIFIRRRDKKRRAANGAKGKLSMNNHTRSGVIISFIVFNLYKTIHKMLFRIKYDI